MWSVLEPRVETVRRDLAREFGCDPEEIAITRNASEGAGDPDPRHRPEARATRSSSPTRTTAGCSRPGTSASAARASSSRTISLQGAAPLDRSTSSTRSASAITPRTRVIEFPHIVNITGQILPVREVVEIARPQGHRGLHRRRPFVRPLPVHARRARTATTSPRSLHKWLLAPIGTGLLYVRKAKIKSIWPLMAAAAGQSDRHPQVRGDRHAPGRQPQRCPEKL